MAKLVFNFFFSLSEWQVFWVFFIFFLLFDVKFKRKKQDEEKEKQKQNAKRFAFSKKKPLKNQVQN